MSLFKSICRRGFGALVFAGLAAASLWPFGTASMPPRQISPRKALALSVSPTAAAVHGLSDTPRKVTPK